MGAKSRAKAERRAAPKPEAERGDSGRHVRAGAVLFVIALLVRVLFWQATPDRSWPYSAWYKGDAPVWMDYARALQADRPFELGIPIHPPGAGYLVAALWSGQADGVAWLRFAWALMGALLVVLVYAAVLRSFGFAAAVISSYLCAASSGLLLLGSSVNNEVPYLLLVVASLVLWEDARRGASPARLAVFAALNGIACLFRVEHVLCFALLLGLLLLPWRHAGLGPMAGRLGLTLAAFVLPMVPWHVTAWRGIATFNDGPRVYEPGEDAAVGQVERALAGSRPARRGPQARRAAGVPPADDVGLRHRHGRPPRRPRGARGGLRHPRRGVRVLPAPPREASVRLVVRPSELLPGEPSRRARRISTARRSTSGRSWRVEPSATPAFLVQGLPRRTSRSSTRRTCSSSTTAIGWAGRPSVTAGRLARAVRPQAAHLLVGRGAGRDRIQPAAGMSGLRRTVDLVVPEGALASTWSAIVLAACGLGLYAGRNRPALLPWLAFVASKLLVTLLFFGYARQGAMTAPVVALLAALAIERWALPLASRLPARRAAALAVIVAAAPVLLEGARWATGPEVSIDGRAVGAGDPFPPHEHRDQAVRVR